MQILLEKHFEIISSPANLLINDQIKKYREFCKKNKCLRPYHHFAFGQSPFPPHPEIIESLKENAVKHSYLPTAGLPELRNEIAGYYKRNFDIDCSSDQIIVSPGSKEIISIILSVLEGDVFIPTPAWVSYLPQAKILKKDTMSIRTQPENNYKLTADALLEVAKLSNFKQHVLILNHPNNPTGCVYNKNELIELADVCRKNNIIVISDEIYALTTYEFEKFISMGKIYPEGTIITGGLSKDRSCGGYRLGVGIFPKEPKDLIKFVTKVAGSTYSCVAAPIQYAAITAYSENESIDRYVKDCREIIGLIGNKMSSLILSIPSVNVTIPQGGFYLYVDFNAYKENFIKLGFDTCSKFCEHLISVEHTALLPGDSLLLDDDDFSVRCSFVDFDGFEVYNNWKKQKPNTTEEKEEFIIKNFPLLIDGVSFIKRYLLEIEKGKIPQHLMRM